MTINIRPEAVNLDYYPGNPIVLTIDFPAGYLSTRTIKSFLNGRGVAGVEGSCVEATDTLTVTFTAAQTDDFDYPVVWELDLFDATPNPDTYEVLLTGLWTPGTDGNNGPVATAFTVEISPALTVTVQTVAITTSLAMSLGTVLTKFTDAAAPFSLTAGSSFTVLTEVLMDGTTGSLTGVAWSDANNRFDVTVGGLFYIGMEVGVDSGALAAGTGHFALEATTSADVLRGPDVPYGAGVDMEYHFNGCLYVADGGFVDLRARTVTSTRNLDWAELSIRRLTTET